MMKERTLQILTALIQDFVETANPVASKRLLTSGEFQISSATIRNEFALLEEIGFIRSPHVSAGKIPTQEGYRFFVDELMEESEEELAAVTHLFQKYKAQYQLNKTKETLFDLIRLLSQLSGNVAFVSVENDQTFYIGLSNVLRAPEFAGDPEKAARIIEIFEGKAKFQQMLGHIDLPENQVKIFIGEENMLEEVRSCAMVVSAFNTNGAKGHIGILGPMRMRYGFNKALIQNVLGLL